MIPALCARCGVCACMLLRAVCGMRPSWGHGQSDHTSGSRIHSTYFLSHSDVSGYSRTILRLVSWYERSAVHSGPHLGPLNLGTTDVECFGFLVFFYYFCPFWVSSSISIINSENPLRHCDNLQASRACSISALPVSYEKPPHGEIVIHCALACLCRVQTARCATHRAIWQDPRQEGSHRMECNELSSAA